MAECCQIGYLACFILEINRLAMPYLHGEQSFFCFWLFCCLFEMTKGHFEVAFSAPELTKRFVVRNNLYENMFYVTFIFIQIKFTDGFSVMKRSVLKQPKGISEMGYSDNFAEKVLQHETLTYLKWKHSTLRVCCN